MKTVALIGTNHKYQFPENAAAGEFQDFVEQVCVVSKVAAIAEEMSLEALSKKRASQSVCKKITAAAGIAHRYCDPSNEQRKVLHIRQEQDIRLEAFFKDWVQERLEREIRASHKIRERHWLNQILLLDIWPVLFICGADHIESFREALEISGLHVDVVARDWAPSR